MIARGKTGQTGIDELTGHTLDISEWLDFDFYYCVWWIDKKQTSTTDDNIILGQWIRISHRIGSGMGYWVLMMSGKVVAWTTVYNVICTDLIDTDTKHQINKFNEELEKRLDSMNFVDDVGAYFYLDNMDEADKVAHGDWDNNLSDEAYGDMMAEERPEQDYIDDAAYDKYIGVEVIMDVLGEGPRSATVRRRVEYLNGEKLGMYHQIPLMDTQEYELEYDDGTHD